MHPGMFGWWNARRRAAFEAMGQESACEAGCGPHASAWAGHEGHRGRYGHRHGSPPDGGGDEFGGGGLGVRRPLRFLAFKLELDEVQVTTLATILSDLKTERAQFAVDQRRTTAALAEAIAGEAFDEPAAKGAADERTKSNERVQSAVVRALGRMHAMLKPEQRATLAYLLRTGALSI